MLQRVMTITHNFSRYRLPLLMAIQGNLLVAGFTMNANFNAPPLPTAMNDRLSLAQSNGFGDYSSWVIPGCVMQGRNPTTGRGSAFDRINTIVNEGKCSTFVCLQAEAAPQDETENGVLGGVEDWKTTPMKFDSYKEDVIQAISMSGNSQLQPSFLHYGIRDFDVADSLEGLDRLIANLADRIRSGEVLYLHCWGGKGRAGLVSACLIGEFYDIGANEALERISAYANLRVSPGTAIHSPETEAQKDQVRAFYQYKGRRI